MGFTILWAFSQMLMPDLAVAQKLQQAKPWLGVSIGEHPKGILVKKVISGTPAQKGGIQDGDVITAIDDKKPKSVQNMIAEIAAKGIGHSVKVELLRADKPLTLKMALEAKPEMLEIVRAKLLNKPAPDFKLQTVYGLADGNLSANKGKVVLLQFWATWCPACRASHDALSKVAKDWGPKGLQILAISTEEKATIQKYLQAKKAGFSAQVDPEGKVSSQYDVPALPMMVVVDQKGIVKHVAIGAGRYLLETLQVVEKLLGK